MKTLHRIQSTLRRHGATFTYGLACAALAYALAGCTTPPTKGPLPVLTLKSFMGKDSTQITAWAACQQDLDEYLALGNGLFMPVSQEGGDVAYFVSGDKQEIVRLPVGSVYSAENGYIFTAGTGSAGPEITGRSENGNGDPVYDALGVSLVEGNHIYVPIYFGAVRYHLAWVVQTDGTFMMGTPAGDCFVPADGSPEVVIFEAQLDASAGTFAFSYPIGVSDDGNGGFFAALPTGKDCAFTGGADLVFPVEMLADVAEPVSARPIIETGRPHWYIKVPESGFVTRRDQGLFNDGDDSLPAGSLIVLPNSDVIFRPGTSEQAISVNADGTVMLWPGSSYDVMGGALTEVEVPGYYNLLTRTFHPMSSGTVTVTFDANGGDMDVDQRGYMSDLVYGAFPEAAKAGHYFLGWYTDADHSNGVHRTTTATVPNADHTLYAGWIPQAHVYHVVNGQKEIDDNFVSGTYVIRGLNAGDIELSTIIEFYPAYVTDGTTTYGYFDTRNAMAAILADRMLNGIGEAVIIFGNPFDDDFGGLIDMSPGYSAANNSLAFDWGITHIRGSVTLPSSTSGIIWVSDSSAPVDVGGDVDSAFEISGGASVRIDAFLNCENKFFRISDNAAVTMDGGILVSMCLEGNGEEPGSIRIEEDARLTVNGGGVLAGGLLTTVGFRVLDAGAVTINGGVISSLSMAGGFGLADSASVVVNGGRFGTSRVYWEDLIVNMAAASGLDLSGGEWLIDTFLARLPVTWFITMYGSPLIEVNGGTFFGNVTTYISSQSIIGLLPELGLGFVTLDPGLTLGGTPEVIFNGGTFDNMVNIAVTSPLDDNVTLGNVKMAAELRNIVLALDASVGIDTATFQRGRYTVSVYEEADLVTALTDSFMLAVSTVLLGDSDKLWPAAEIEAIFDGTPVVPENGQVVVRGGAPFQADFIPYGFPGYRFAIVDDDLVYTLIPWNHTVTILNAFEPGGASTNVLARYEEPMPPFDAVTSTNGYIFLGCSDAAGVWYYDNTGNSLKDWDKDGDGELHARWFNPATDTDWVAFFANGGAFIGADSDSPHMYMQLAAVTGGIYPVPAIPTLEGHNLVGWNTEADGSGFPIIPGTDAFITGASTQTLYAVWTDCTTAHAVTLWHNTGTTPDTSDIVNVRCGTAMPFVSAPVSASGTFIGYFDTATQMRMYYDADMASVRNWDTHANGELTASYASEYSAVFHANGGTFEGATSTEVYMQEIATLPPAGLENTHRYGFPAIPVRAGYTFTGWNTQADGSGDSVEHGIDTPVSALLLFARWQIKPTVPPEDPEPIVITAIRIDEGTVFITVKSADPAAPGERNVSVTIKGSMDLTAGFEPIPGVAVKSVSRAAMRGPGVTFDIPADPAAPTFFYRAFSAVEGTD